MGSYPNMCRDDHVEIGHSQGEDCPLCAAYARIGELERMDREAASHVESVICMRTHFTGEPPYVGWKGLGLALTEALDERDNLKKR